jgi:Sulfotransferase family
LTAGAVGKRLGPLPTFLVIGAPRSGTTGLWRSLRQHPDVFMAPAKELRFFLGPISPPAIERYRENFGDWRGERAVGEATPVYMYSEDALERMAELVPEARLLVILRDPVDRAYSDYWQRRADGREDRTFAEVVAAGGAIYVRRSRYVTALERVCAHFPREALHVLLFEDLCRAPGEVFGSICQHLGVSTEFVPTEPGAPANSFVHFRSQRVRAVARRLPGLAGRVLGRLNSGRRPYPPLASDLRRVLRRQLESDNERLASWLGRELTPWEDGGSDLSARA